MISIVTDSEKERERTSLCEPHEPKGMGSAEMEAEYTKHKVKDGKN